MQYTLSVKERVNLDHFEFIEITGSVEFSDDEAEGNPNKFAQEKLDALLLCHRRRAAELLPEGAESFISYHPALET